VSDNSSIESLAKKVDKLEDEVDALRAEAREREMAQMRWGIRALGAVVMLMGGWIWSQIGHMFHFGAGGK